MSHNVYTIQTQDGSDRYEAVEAPQQDIRDDLGTSDLIEQTVWADRFATESGVTGWYDNGTWRFRRGDSFGGRSD